MTLKDFKQIINSFDSTLDSAEVAIVGRFDKNSSLKCITDFTREDISAEHIFNQKALVIDITQHNSTTLN